MQLQVFSFEPQKLSFLLTCDTSLMQFGVIEPRAAGGNVTGVEDGRDPAIS